MRDEGWSINFVKNLPNDVQNIKKDQPEHYDEYSKLKMGTFWWKADWE